MSREMIFRRKALGRYDVWDDERRLGEVRITTCKGQWGWIAVEAFDTLPRQSRRAGLRPLFYHTRAEAAATLMHHVAA